MRPSAPVLLQPAAAWYVTDILRGAPVPPSATPGAVAFKTGTSYGFRDAWAAGFDGEYTIAVWVGRAGCQLGAGACGLAGGGAGACSSCSAPSARTARRSPPRPPT